MIMLMPACQFFLFILVRPTQSVLQKQKQKSGFVFVLFIFANTGPIGLSKPKFDPFRSNT
jgi:hypothetical protein